MELAGSALRVLRIALFYLALLGVWQLIFSLHVWAPYLGACLFNIRLGRIIL
jgi:hypothetical protein